MARDEPPAASLARTAPSAETASASTAVVLCVANGRFRVVTVTGSCAAPPDPDWHWRTEVEYREATLRPVMYNISPGSEEALAVEARYARVPAEPYAARA